ncbi:MAG: pilus assembly PilX N-terminal domain-containing protein [Pseudomonadota bacterium]
MTIQHTVQLKFVYNEQGSALVMALLLLVVLTILGISATTTSNIELKIASNDMLNKKAFYAADGGTEVGREMIEQNISCADGFQSQPLAIGPLVVEKKSFAYQEDEPTGDYPSDAIRDLHFPADDTKPHTNIVIFGNTKLSTGSAIQMAAGYEGKGKGSAWGGAEIIYDVHSRHQGRQNSRSDIMINYRHIIGHEGNCNF